MAHDTVGDLIRAVERNGANQIEVIRGEANSFAIRKSSLASCTVILLEHEPTFHVDFDLGLTSMNGVTFNVSLSDASEVAPAASHAFPNVDEAARWLLSVLDIPTR